jgi:L-malate glycosyltransferase
MMHLVHITASLGIGGAESVLCTLVQELQKMSVAQTVIAFRDGPYAARIRGAGIHVEVINGLFCRYDPFFWYRLFRCVRRLHPDCIHSLLWASNIAARIIGKMLNVPVVSGIHNSTVLYGKLCNWVDRMTLPLACHVVVIHEGVQASVVARCPQHRYLPVTVIHNCVDCKEVHQQASADLHNRAEFGLTKDHFVIGAVGRLIPIKRYDLLIDQFARVHRQKPHARLMLIGYGPEEARLRQLAEKVGVKGFVFFVVGKQAYGYFPLFDCFVLPSLTEGPAIALLEAMSFGLPCVVTHDMPSHPVITHNENGILLNAYDKDALNAALILLLENKKIAEQLGACAQMTVQSLFSAKTMTENYYAVFKEAVRVRSVGKS